MWCFPSIVLLEKIPTTPCGSIGDGDVRGANVLAESHDSTFRSRNEMYGAYMTLPAVLGCFLACYALRFPFLWASCERFVRISRRL